MEPENKLRIQANFKDIVQNVAVSDVQDHLIQFGLLTDEEQEWVSMKLITRQEGKTKHCTTLLILKRRPEAVRVI